MTQNPFLEVQTNVVLNYMKVAESNMKSAADEVRKIDGGPENTEDENISTTISTDGTWQSTYSITKKTRIYISRIKYSRTVS